jgi:AraC family transcriptional regulator
MTRQPAAAPYTQTSALACFPKTLGHPAKSINLDGFTVIKSTYRPSIVLPSHAHEGATVSLVRRGYFTEVLRRQPYECRAFDLLIEPAGELHTDEFGRHGATCLHIAIAAKRRALLREFSDVLDSPAHFSGGLLPTFVTKLDLELSIMDNASALAIEGLVLEILAHSTRCSSDAATTRLPRWLSRTEELLRSKYASKLSLHEIAATAGVNASHLARTFRKHFHCSIGEYLRALRIEAAIALIMRGNTPMAEIATLVGFCDQSHFTNAFRKQTGATPARFAAQVIA